MKTAFAIDSILKTALMGVAIMGLAACGDKSASSTSGGAVSNGERSQYEVVGDHAIGNPDAPITVVEYASVTCVACKNWHDAVYTDLRKKYIDTGKVRFVFREFPTPPESLAVEGFLIANCAPEDKFFSIISLQFDRQSELLQSARERRAREEYEALAKVAGLSSAKYEACRNDEAERARLTQVIKKAQERGVAATPTFYINGVKSKVFTLESFEEQFGLYIDMPKPEGDAEETDAAGAANE